MKLLHCVLGFVQRRLALIPGLFLIFQEDEQLINLINMKTNFDIELFTTIKDKLYTAVVGDMMDQMGFQNQFLSP